MPKFDIAAIVGAVRSPLQFAALLAVLAFLSLLILRLVPEEGLRVRPDGGPPCPSRTDRPQHRSAPDMPLEYGRRLH